jgi:hypothetical protein
MAGVDWKSIISTVAPTIATALGGPLAGMATSAVSKALLGKADGTAAEIEDTITKSTDPSILLKVKQADQEFAAKMKELDIDVYKIGAEDRASARSREVALKDWMPKVLALLYTFGYFLILTLLWYHPIPADSSSKDLLNTLLGVISAAQMAIITYYFGSSAGSARKSEMIDQMKKT